MAIDTKLGTATWGGTLGISRILRFVVVIAAWAYAAPAYAQGCAMCYNTAAAAKAAAIRALQSGILILLVPPILMFIGIFALAFRSRERPNEPGGEESELDRELSEWLARADSTGEGDRETLGAEFQFPLARSPRLPRATHLKPNHPRF